MKCKGSKPAILEYYPHTQFPNPIYQLSQVAPTLKITTPTLLEKTSAEACHRTCYFNYQITSGTHYFQVKMINPGPNAYIMFGIVKDGFSLNGSTYPGSDANSFGYYFSSGNKYHRAGAAGFAQPTKQAGSTVGMLVDMDARTITYFADGQLLGTAFGSDSIPAGQTWYPAIALYELSAVAIEHFE